MPHGTYERPQQASASSSAWPVLGTPPQRWEYAQTIAAGAMGLLRRYEEARAAG